MLTKHHVVFEGKEEGPDLVQDEVAGLGYYPVTHKQLTTDLDRAEVQPTVSKLAEEQNLSGKRNRCLTSRKSEKNSYYGCTPGQPFEEATC